LDALRPAAAQSAAALPGIPAFALSEQASGEAVLDAGGQAPGDFDEELAYKVISDATDKTPTLATMCSEAEYRHREDKGEGAFSEMERDPVSKEVRHSRSLVRRLVGLLLHVYS